MRRLASGLRYLAVALTLAAARPTLAQPTETAFSPVQIEAWTAPDQCPSKQALLDAVAAELEAAPPTELGELKVKIAITKNASGFRLRLVLGAEGQSREVSGATCGAVIVAAALTLAMALEVADDAGAPPVEVEAPPSLAPAAPAPEVVYRRRPTAMSAAVRLGWLLEAGLLPGLASGIELGTGIEVSAWRIDFGVGYWFERETEVMTPGAEISALVVPIRLCRRLSAVLSVAACGGVEIGAFQARGIDLPQTREDSALLLAPTAGITAGHKLIGPWWLRAYAGAALMLRRPSFG
ncbi:MAG: hypothetical protein KJO07_14765, partial [Deltaproteobacteria bacterium]|nr:hypothetical protein [Deltaproteobacteria bacterium]